MEITALIYFVRSNLFFKVSFGVVVVVEFEIELFSWVSSIIPPSEDVEPLLLLASYYKICEANVGRDSS